MIKKQCFCLNSDLYIGHLTDIYNNNDPKHTCKRAQNWLQDHDTEVLLWLAQSPDLDQIEHPWNHLKKMLAEYEIPHRKFGTLGEGTKGMG